MLVETLELLRCPFCGGRLELVTSLFHRRDDREVREGILGCQCCIFPVVDGIPILHVLPAAAAAREHMEAGRPREARRVMIGLDEDGQAADRFEAIAESDRASYRDVVESLGPNFEGGYFLYRFSDPTYVVAEAVVGAVAAAVLSKGRRAVDICGGSGHLTRILVDLSSAPPILADLYFAKLWLARRFTAPGCEPICCDGNAPFPFVRGAFGYAMCSDAFQYIWTKRQFVGELLRLVDGGDRPGAAVINHTHNQLTWSPSHGQPLTPAGYRDLFEGIEPRLFAESALFADVVRGGPLDLSREDPPAALDADPALTLIATREPSVYRRHPLPAAITPRGRFQPNPLYRLEPDGDRVRLRLQFPSADYEDEYGACRQYLPDEVVVDRAALAALERGEIPESMADLIRRRVIVDLPRGY